MPTPATANFPAPQSDDEFEQIVADALRLMFKAVMLVRFGRRGQRQRGIDGFDPTGPLRDSIVWQATLQQQDLKAKLVDDLSKFDAGFPEQPKLFVVAFGASKRDVSLQLAVQEMSVARLVDKKCPLLPLFWDDLQSLICTDVALTQKYFSAFFVSAAVHAQSLSESAEVVRWASQIRRAVSDWMNACIDSGVPRALESGPIVTVTLKSGDSYMGIPRLGSWDVGSGCFAPERGDGSSDMVRLETAESRIDIPLSSVSSFVVDFGRP